LNLIKLVSTKNGENILFIQFCIYTVHGFYVTFSKCTIDTFREENRAMHTWCVGLAACLLMSTVAHHHQAHLIIPFDAGQLISSLPGSFCYTSWPNMEQIRSTRPEEEQGWRDFPFGLPVSLTCQRGWFRANIQRWAPNALKYLN
jgi:hypothetical protein